MKRHDNPTWPEVGNVEIDREHRRLLAVLARLDGICSVSDGSPVCQCSAATQRECVDAAAQQLSDLFDYVIDHFFHEEKRMDGLPRTPKNLLLCEAHKHDHAEMARALSALAYSLDKCCPRQSIRELSSQIHDWTERHITDHDVALAKMLATQG